MADSLVARVAALEAKTTSGRCDIGTATYEFVAVGSMHSYEQRSDDVFSLARLFSSDLIEPPPQPITAHPTTGAVWPSVVIALDIVEVTAGRVQLGIGDAALWFTSRLAVCELSGSSCAGPSLAGWRRLGRAGRRWS